MEKLLTLTQLAKYLRCRSSDLALMTEACRIPAIDVSIGCRPKYRYALGEVIDALRVKPPEIVQRRARREYAKIKATFIV
jgi:hypothetical protein